MNPSHPIESWRPSIRAPDGAQLHFSLTNTDNEIAQVELTLELSVSAWNFTCAGWFYAGAVDRFRKALGDLDSSVSSVAELRNEDGSLCIRAMGLAHKQRELFSLTFNFHSVVPISNLAVDVGLPTGADFSCGSILIDDLEGIKSMLGTALRLVDKPTSGTIEYP